MDISSKVPHTPCYVVDEGLLRRNLQVLGDVQQRTGCKIILALKGFAMFSVFPVIKEYLSGVSASSLDEARLGSERFGGDVHVCAPAYKDDEFAELISYASHIVFNSFAQWERFKQEVSSSGKNVQCALRINPEHSEVKVPLYDPCAPCSRLGVRAEQIRDKDLKGITGLHFHALCELNSDSLERMLDAIEKKFGFFLEHIKWINFGGGHHITRPDYDVDRLCRVIESFHSRYGVEVYLEPGEAIALNTGVLVTSVLDVVHNEKDIAILDTSAVAHMPDVLEMPYRPEIEGAALPDEYEHTYRLGGLTCLAGDIIGDYSFREPLLPGKRLVFKDMAHYTMVKNNTFNGVRLPSIAIYHPQQDTLDVIREFAYEDYLNRLS